MPSPFPVTTVPCTRSPPPPPQGCSPFPACAVTFCASLSLWSPFSPCSGSDSLAQNHPHGLRHTMLNSPTLALTRLSGYPVRGHILHHAWALTLTPGYSLTWAPPPPQVLIHTPHLVFVLTPCSRSLLFVESPLALSGSDTLHRAALECGPPPCFSLARHPALGC